MNVPSHYSTTLKKKQNKLLGFHLVVRLHNFLQSYGLGFFSNLRDLHKEKKSNHIFLLLTVFIVNRRRNEMK